MDNLNKINPLEASLAIIWTLGGISFFFCAASGVFKGTESIQTQITQGIFGIVMLISGYYWGNSAAKKSNSANSIQTQDNASINIEASKQVDPKIEENKTNI